MLITTFRKLIADLPFLKKLLLFVIALCNSIYLQAISYETYSKTQCKSLNQYLEGAKCILSTGGPSSRLEKKPMINSWTCHALCDSVLSYERNRWKFEHVIRNSMGNEILSIYNGKSFISKYEYFTHQINSTYSHPVCSLTLSHTMRDAFMN